MFQSLSNPRSMYYAKIAKTCAKYGLTVNDWKENPHKLFLVDKKTREYVYKTFDPSRTISWFGKDYTWKDHIPTSFYNVIESEDLTWFHKTQTGLYQDNNEDDVEMVNVSDENNQFKKQKTSHESKTPESSATTSADKGSNKNQLPKTTSTDTEDKTANNKRPGSSSNTGDSTKRVKNTESSTTHIATGIAEIKTGGNTQSNITGPNTADQEELPQQRETPSGPEHNTRGSLQGEAGNLKIQKPLERYGIVKVITNMNTMKKFNNKVFLFISDNKELMNDLIELMYETYESGNVYNHNLTALSEDIKQYLKGYYYVVAWELPFNISYPTLALKLGHRYNKLYTFQKVIDDFDKVDEILEQAVIVRFKNDTQLLTLAEMVEKTQSDYKKYQDDGNKRKRARCSKFD